MTIISTTMMMAAGFGPATLVSGTGSAEARGFGHDGHSYRHRFGGLGLGYPMGFYNEACRVVLSPVTGTYVRICG